MIIEAMKQAVDAMKNELAISMEDFDEFVTAADKLREAIASLEKAIAEAENQFRDATELIKQEPVAWWNGKGSVVFIHEEISTPNWTDYYNIPLYTRPPKREWVGLTEQQHNDIEDQCEMIIGKPAFEAIEVKLKELNT